MANKKLIKLVDDYWEIEQLRRELKERQKKVKARIISHFKFDSGPLEESVAKKFKKITKACEDDLRTKVVNYSRKNTNADWEYLESVLHPNQIRRAKIVTHSAIVKIDCEVMNRR